MATKLCAQIQISMLAKTEKNTAKINCKAVVKFVKCKSVYPVNCAVA